VILVLAKLALCALVGGGLATARAIIRGRRRRFPEARALRRLPQNAGDVGIRKVPAASSARIPSADNATMRRVLRSAPAGQSVRISSPIPYADIPTLTPAEAVRAIAMAAARIELLRELHDRGDISDRVFHREMREASVPINAEIDRMELQARRERERDAYVRPEPLPLPGEPERCSR
jgi:hypothetical protein